ncbi:MAG TPA: 50S ribosomal protein L11 methyltransferase [Alphaproteobacteria bacterium]|nr:50S ribosomal protein L11 methyltransferase [Alphaproteobacteria bacterium]
MKRAMPILWRIAFSASATSREPITAALEEICDVVSCFESETTREWRFEGLLATRPERAAIEARLRKIVAALDESFPSIDIAPLEKADWLRENQRSFPPRHVGTFFVHPTHGGRRPPAGAVAIAIDAGIAFGSGEHATTRGCLVAIDMLTRRGSADRRRIRRARDLGCGSGILALAMACALRRPIAASDLDRDAVTTTRDNARLNGVARLIRAWRADGMGRPAAMPARSGPPYDLIVANILARPLCRMMRDIAAALAPRGRLILSGFLPEQVPEILAVYRLRRLRLRRQIAIDGWRTLILAR